MVIFVRVVDIGQVGPFLVCGGHWPHGMVDLSCADCCRLLLVLLLLITKLLILLLLPQQFTTVTTTTTTMTTTLCFSFG